MSETENYKLYLTDDDSERFLDWRNKINGADNSNMTIIDRVLGQKADKSLIIDAVLAHNDWTSNNGLYTQEITNEALKKEQNGIISVSCNATTAQRNSARNSMLFILNQDDGKLVVAADGCAPSEDIPVTIILLG